MNRENDVVVTVSVHSECSHVGTRTTEVSVDDAQIKKRFLVSSHRNVAERVNKISATPTAMYRETLVDVSHICGRTTSIELTCDEEERIEVRCSVTNKYEPGRLNWARDLRGLISRIVRTEYRFVILTNM